MRTQRACGCIYYGDTLYERCPDLDKLKGDLVAALDLVGRSGRSVVRRVKAESILANAREQFDVHRRP